MEIVKAGNTYIVSCNGIEIRFYNINFTGDNITALIKVYVTLPIRKQISISKLNLLAPRSISELAKRLNDIWEADWSGILQSACTKIIDNVLTPPEPEQITIIENTMPVFLVSKFILENSPNLWFAPGGSGKSFLALSLAICVENGFDFFGSVSPNRALYLDWETDKQETDRRASMIAGGLSETYEIEKSEILLPKYSQMYFPLVDAIDSMLEIVYNYDIRFVVIDSIAPALGGNLISDADATKFFSAVRKLNAAGITTLLITHVSKGEKKGDGKRTPFGSVFFENFPRLTWEIRSEYNEEQKVFSFGIFCRKTNVGKLEPKGISLAFDGDKIIMGYIDPDDTEISDERQTIQEMILAILQDEDKALTPKELTTLLNTSAPNVWNALSRMSKKGLIESAGYGKWRATKKESPF